MQDLSWAEIRVVVFDVGQTLIDETRHWSEWADWLGIPRFTFLAAMGGAIARGEPHRRAFEQFRPGIAYATLVRQRIAQGWRYECRPADFYPDALPCLSALRQHGYKIGIAGNQPAIATASLAACGLTADFMVMSQELGVEKPDLRFFEGVIRRSGESDPHHIAYVGDRIDNDVIPAVQAGMQGIFIRRGPWAFLQSFKLQAQAAAKIESLLELPTLLRET